MRRALLPRLPQLTKFYQGAIHPLNVDDYTLRELIEYVRQMDDYLADQAKSS